MVNRRLLHRLSGALFCFCLLLLIVGCGSVSTRNKFYEPLAAELRAGNYEAVAAKIEKAQAEGKFKEKDRFLYYLDAGLAYHYASQFDSSNIRLTDAERTAEELYTKSVSKAFLANTFLNDNVLEYAGEDYEVLYANLIMALNYLALDKFDDAFVEIRRANDKLSLLEQKYVNLQDQLRNQAKSDTSRVYVDYNAKKVRFNNSAFARYLSMHMYAVDGKFDDARIDYDYFQEAFRSQPHIYSFDPPDVTYSGDQPVLSIVALTGMEPTKEALNLRIRTDKQLNLLTVIYTDTSEENTIFANFPLPDGIGDFYAKLSIPQLVPQPSVVSTIRVTVGDQLLGELQLIEDIGMVAQVTYEAKQSLILWRTVIRTIGKSLLSSRLKKKVDDGGVGGWLKKLAVDVAQDISENADLRGSHLLPGQIYVGDFEISPGVYDLTVEFLDSHGSVVARNNFPGYTVSDNNLNMLQVRCLR